MQWCEIFKAGEHTDSNGNKRVWTVNDLDNIVRNFNEKNSSVPAVIGHPKVNSPAYAWIDSVKRFGDSLYCTYKQVNQDFAQWVKQGLYKNRSISLYPDGTLRHVGFLGAMPPAIKGLEAFQFNEESDCETYDFGELSDFNFDNGTPQNERKEQALTDNLMIPPTPPETQVDFSEELKQKDEKLAQLQQENNALCAKNRKIEFEQFTEKALEKGNITPAQKDEVLEFMEACHQAGTYDFTEGEDKSVLSRFKSFIEKSKQINFDELKDGEEVNISEFSDGKDAEKKITAIIEKAKAEGRIINPAQALLELKKGNNNV